MSGTIGAIRERENALASAEHLAREGFVAESLLIRSRLAEARKDPEAAVSLLLAALEELRKKPLPLCDANLRGIRRAGTLAAQVPARATELLRAFSRPFAVLKDELFRRKATSLLGAKLGNPLCVEALGPHRALPPWELSALALRAQCLERAGAPDAAAAHQDWLDFRAHQPHTFREVAAQPDAAEHAAGAE